jgi:hypothetical protein
MRTIRAITCISGGHFYSESRLVFKSATLISPALDEWIIWDKFIDEIDKGKYLLPDHQEVVNTTIGTFSLTIR